MNGKIFVVDGSCGLHSLSEQEFGTEDNFQALLETYPDLLPGDQINEAAPRRWLLVSREYGVPDAEGATNRWALDHLFLDQDGIPTLVEIKRRSDTRLTDARREVVGQMLDYAANAVVYWPVETMRARFEAACYKRGESALEVIGGFIDAVAGDDSIEAVEAVVDTFWNRVDTNLRAGNIRLIFVADQIPLELKRIVEFLNTYMTPVEVLAVELRHYEGTDADGRPIKTLVPQVIGLTAAARPTAQRETRQWDEASFIQELETKRSVEEANVARRIIEWAGRNSLQIEWGKGRTEGSLMPVLSHAGTKYKLPYVTTLGSLWINFAGLKAKPPFNNESKLAQLLSHFNELEGVALTDEALSKTWSSVRLSALTSEASQRELLSVLDWMLAEIKST
jgi:hypothetical protein